MLQYELNELCRITLKKVKENIPDGTKEEQHAATCAAVKERECLDNEQMAYCSENIWERLN
jgi:hypothetical protein